MLLHFLVLLFASFGLSETVFLIRKRKSEEAPVCFIGGDCHKVLDSKWNKTLGVHNDLVGVVFYVAVLVAVALLEIGIGPADQIWIALDIAVGLASLASLYFTFLQWKVIKAWCFWCLMSGATNLALLVLILLHQFVPF